MSTLDNKDKNSNPPPSTELQFRPKRITSSQSKLYMEVLDNKFDVVNFSRTGVAFQVPNDFPFEEGKVISNAKVKSKDYVIYEGPIEVRAKTTHNDNTQIGARLLKLPFLIEKIDLVDKIIPLETYKKELDATYQQANHELSTFILRLSSYLKTLSESCASYESNLENMSYETRLICEKEFLTEMSNHVTKDLITFNKELGNILDIDNVDENSFYHELFEEHIYPYFETSDIAYRAKTKPLGYAGDYEMMNQVYRSGFEGKTLLGKILHKYTVDEVSSLSVKFRRPFFKKHIKAAMDANPSGVTTILSLASGPGIEIQDLVEELSQTELDKLEFFLLDLDPRALEFAQVKIYEKLLKLNKKIKLNFVNVSVKEFLTKKEIINKKFDLIYSGGLFDYLDNLTSSAVVTSLYKYLKPNASMIIGNFTHENPSKGFCHLVVKWHLIHKDEKDMIDWYKPLSIKPEHIKVHYDEQKINAFVHVTKS